MTERGLRHSHGDPIPRPLFLPALQQEPARAYPGGFALRPGAGGGTQPDMRYSKPSTRLPCSKRVRLQVMMAPVAASSARRCRTFATGTPVSLASSESSR